MAPPKRLPGKATGRPVKLGGHGSPRVKAAVRIVPIVRPRAVYTGYNNSPETRDLF